MGQKKDGHVDWVAQPGRQSLERRKAFCPDKLAGNGPDNNSGEIAWLLTLAMYWRYPDARPSA